LTLRPAAILPGRTMPRKPHCAYTGSRVGPPSRSYLRARRSYNGLPVACRRALKFRRFC